MLILGIVLLILGLLLGIHLLFVLGVVLAIIGGVLLAVSFAGHGPRLY